MVICIPAASACFWRIQFSTIPPQPPCRCLRINDEPARSGAQKTLSLRWKHCRRLPTAIGHRVLRPVSHLRFHGQRNGHIGHYPPGHFHSYQRIAVNIGFNPISSASCAGTGLIRFAGRERPQATNAVRSVTGIGSRRNLYKSSCLLYGVRSGSVAHCSKDLDGGGCCRAIESIALSHGFP